MAPTEVDVELRTLGVWGHRVGFTSDRQAKVHHSWAIRKAS